jgi:hypothetical protein
MILALLLSICMTDVEAELDCIAIVRGDTLRRVWLLPRRTDGKIDEAKILQLPSVEWVPKLGQIILTGQLRAKKIKLSQLQRFDELEAIDFSYASMGDDAIEEIAKCKSLQEIVLDHTTVTDSDILILRTLPKLRKLSVFRTKVTKEGISALIQQNPNIEVNYQSRGRIAKAADGYQHFDLDDKPEQ